MTLGGGIDSLQGLHGLHRLLLNSLETVRLVTAMGDLIEVSDTKYPELCVGVPFAGSNFPWSCYHGDLLHTSCNQWGSCHQCKPHLCCYRARCYSAGTELCR